MMILNFIISKNPISILPKNWDAHSKEMQLSESSSHSQIKKSIWSSDLEHGKDFKMQTSFFRKKFMLLFRWLGRRKKKRGLKKGVRLKGTASAPIHFLVLLTEPTCSCREVLAPELRPTTSYCPHGNLKKIITEKIKPMSHIFTLDLTHILTLTQLNKQPVL